VIGLAECLWSCPRPKLRMPGGSIAYTFFPLFLFFSSFVAGHAGAPAGTPGEAGSSWACCLVFVCFDRRVPSLEDCGERASGPNLRVPPSKRLGYVVIGPDGLDDAARQCTALRLPLSMARTLF